MSEGFPESDRIEGLPHPRETLSLRGQDAAEEALLAALRSGAMPHAWLFSGPRGVGKATLAYRLARWLLTTGGTREHADLARDLSVPGEDPAVRRIAAQAHGDLLALRRPWDEKRKRFLSVLPVDEVRRLAGFFGKKSAEGGWRIAIVDPADAMNVNAANALLKILEEPPERALLILLSDAPGRLLPTIRSRCRTLTLRPLGDEAITRVLDEAGLALGPEEQDLAIALSEGSAGRALYLAQGGEDLTLARDVLALAGGLPKSRRSSFLDLAARLAPIAAEAKYETAVAVLGRWFHALARAGAGAGAPDPRILKAEDAARLVAASPLADWLSVWETFERGARLGASINLDRQALLIGLFGGMADLAAGRAARLPFAEESAIS